MAYIYIRNIFLLCYDFTFYENRYKPAVQIKIFQIRTASNIPMHTLGKSQFILLHIMQWNTKRISPAPIIFPKQPNLLSNGVFNICMLMRAGADSHTFENPLNLKFV